MRLTDQIRVILDQIDAASGPTPPVVVPPVVTVPPVVVPPVVVALSGNIREAAAAAGFSHAMIYEWDWAGGAITIQTATDSQGPLGRGVVVIAFTVPATAPLGGTGSVSAVGWPITATGVGRTVAISTQPCDFSPHPASNPPSPDDGTWGATGTDVIANFCVGPYMRRGMKAPLVPGQRYFINIASGDDIRIHCIQP